MSESKQGTAAAGAVNSHAPAADDDDQGAAAAAPCGCEPRLEAVEKLARVAGYVALLAAAAVIYLLWFGDRQEGRAGG